MRSFTMALLFLLVISYLAHLFITSDVNFNELTPIIIDNNKGICECRCCLIRDTICETVIRYSIAFKNDFSCNLCTDQFCTMNISQIQQCQWMHMMKANCFQYELHQKPSTYMNIRPILQ